MGSLPTVSALGGLGGYPPVAPAPLIAPPVTPAPPETETSLSQPTSVNYNGTTQPAIIAAAPSATPGEVAADSRELPLRVRYAPSVPPHNVDSATFDRSA